MDGWEQGSISERVQTKKKLTYFSKLCGQRKRDFAYWYLTMVFSIWSQQYESRWTSVFRRVKTFNFCFFMILSRGFGNHGPSSFPTCAYVCCKHCRSTGHEQHGSCMIPFIFLLIFIKRIIPGNWAGFGRVNIEFSLKWVIPNPPNFRLGWFCVGSYWVISNPLPKYDPTY